MLECKIGRYWKGKLVGVGKVAVGGGKDRRKRVEDYLSYEIKFLLCTLRLWGAYRTIVSRFDICRHAKNVISYHFWLF